MIVFYQIPANLLFLQVFTRHDFKGYGHLSKMVALFHPAVEAGGEQRVWNGRPAVLSDGDDRRRDGDPDVAFLGRRDDRGGDEAA